jgi:hypothetical protein
MWGMLFSRHVPLVEKIDVLIPTINLPLSLLFFLFIIDTNFVLTALFSHEKVLTVEFGTLALALPVMQLDAAFTVLNRVDLFVVTWLTLLAPVLCFMIDMWRTPVRLFRFLCQSTALYGALGPLSSLGVFLFAVTGKAVFHVTADRSIDGGAEAAAADSRPGSWWRAVKSFAIRSHPDHWAVQGFEIACGLLFAWFALQSFQIAFFGLALALLLFPLLHHVKWEHGVMQAVIILPLTLVLSGLSMSGLALAGMQTVFFGFGFHF